jgi:hypothetical protein
MSNAGLFPHRFKWRSQAAGFENPERERIRRCSASSQHHQRRAAQDGAENAVRARNAFFCPRFQARQVHEQGENFHQPRFVIIKPDEAGKAFLRRPRPDR